MKYSLTVFLFVGKSLTTENNPDIRTTCDWFAMNIYYVPNRGKMFYIIIKQLHKNWMISIKYS